MTGLFVQLSTLPPNYLPLLLTHLNLHPEMSEIAFTDAQPWNIPNPLPSGKIIYVGSPWVPWWGPRADTPTDLQPWMLYVPGVGGMFTPSYRWDQLAVDQALFDFLPPNTNWYIGQEVGIDALGDHPRLREAWEAYLIEFCKRFYARFPTRQILWSPYAWDAWSTVSIYRRTQIASAMTTLRNNVKLYSKTPGITTIDLQDGRGAQPSEPASDAVYWYNLIRASGKVRINAEFFTTGLTPLPKATLDARLAYYAAQGVPVGCCWEARYWLLVPQYVALPNHSEPTA